jgi:hypothetical protein
MELSTNLAIAAGIIVEILLLWETSDWQKNARSAPGVLSPRLSRLQEIIAILLAVSWLFITLAEYFNPPLSLGMLSFIQNAIMGPSFFFLFVFGMVHPKLLPRINEQTIVVINLVVLYSLLSTSQLAWYWIAALLLPSLGVLVMALTTRIIHPMLKSLLYFWYLICLFIMAYQNNYEMFFKPTSELRLTSLDYFIGGAAGIFLLLHSIFLVRFFLMLSANILPYNRYLINLAMPQLFDDQQIPRLKFLGILALFAGIAALNHFTSFASSLSVLNVLILLAAHFMDRPFTLDQRI